MSDEFVVLDEQAAEEFLASYDEDGLDLAENVGRLEQENKSEAE